MLTLSQIKRSEARQRTYKDGKRELCDCFRPTERELCNCFKQPVHGGTKEDVAADSPRQKQQESDSTSDKKAKRAL